MVITAAPGVYYNATSEARLLHFCGWGGGDPAICTTERPVCKLNADGIECHNEMVYLMPKQAMVFDYVLQDKLDNRWAVKGNPAGAHIKALACGFWVYENITLADWVEIIRASFSRLLPKPDAIIACGGL